MINPTTIANELLTAELKCADLTYANVLALQSGALQVCWSKVRNGQRAINCVQRQYDLSDYGSSQFLQAWSCLNDFVGLYAPGTIDPNAQNPNTIINNIITGNVPPFTVITSNPGWDAGTNTYSDLRVTNKTQVFINSLNRFATFALDGFTAFAGGFSFDPSLFLFSSGDLLLVFV